MKKLKKLIFEILLIPTLAMADFLVCDVPSADQMVTHYKVIDNGIELTDNQPAETDGSLKYDLGEIDATLHNYEAIACNMRGCSEASDPFVLPSVAGVPQNTRWTK